MQKKLDKLPLNQATPQNKKMYTYDPDGTRADRHTKLQELVLEKYDLAANWLNDHPELLADYHQLPQYKLDNGSYKDHYINPLQASALFVIAFDLMEPEKVFQLHENSFLSPKATLRMMINAPTEAPGYTGMKLPNGSHLGEADILRVLENYISSHPEKFALFNKQGKAQPFELPKFITPEYQEKYSAILLGLEKIPNGTCQIIRASNNQGFTPELDAIYNLGVDTINANSSLSIEYKKLPRLNNQRNETDYLQYLFIVQQALHQLPAAKVLEYSSLAGLKILQQRWGDCTIAHRLVHLPNGCDVVDKDLGLLVLCYIDTHPERFNSTKTNTAGGSKARELLLDRYPGIEAVIDAKSDLNKSNTANDQKMQEPQVTTSPDIEVVIDEKSPMYCLDKLRNHVAILNQSPQDKNARIMTVISLMTCELHGINLEHISLPKEMNLGQLKELREEIFTKIKNLPNKDVSNELLIAICNGSTNTAKNLFPQEVECYSLNFFVSDVYKKNYREASLAELDSRGVKPNTAAYTNN